MLFLSTGLQTNRIVHIRIRQDPPVCTHGEPRNRASCPLISLAVGLLTIILNSYLALKQVREQQSHFRNPGALPGSPPQRKKLVKDHQCRVLKGTGSQSVVSMCQHTLVG